MFRGVTTEIHIGSKALVHPLTDNPRRDCHNPANYSDTANYDAARVWGDGRACQAGQLSRGTRKAEECLECTSWHYPAGEEGYEALPFTCLPAY